MDLARPFRLTKLLARDPRELVDRAATRRELREEAGGRHPPAYSPVGLDGAIDRLEAVIGRDLRGFLAEAELSEIEEAVARGKRDMARGGGFPSSWNAGLVLARLCYAVCRSTRPSVGLETGVAHGVTTAFILKALDVNDHGALHSVEPMAREEAERPFVGRLVPDELRGRWNLHAGRSKRVLPSLLPELGPVDLFVHDSLHTYRTTLWELTRVRPHLGSHAVVLADDIEGNSGFSEWAESANPAFWGAVDAEKKGNLCAVAAFSG